MKIWKGALALLALIAIFGINPFAQTVDPQKTITVADGQYKTEVRRLPDGTYLVAVLTLMPAVKAEMVRWWFSSFMKTTEHYKLWHPNDHIWMDWENKTANEIYGASHLVHEYFGSDLNKLRIQFVEPTEFFEKDPNDSDTFVLCARVGFLEEPYNISKMCHTIKNTPFGAEMRTRFWLGHFAKRDGNEVVFSAEGLVGNTALARMISINEQMANSLKVHAVEEMSMLAQILPGLYAAQNLQ